VRFLDEMRAASTRRREHTIDAALGVVVAWAAGAITNADSISVTLRRHGRLTTVASSDDTATRLDLDQYATGEGPCVHATVHGEVALVPSTADDAHWPGFLPRARNAGIGAILSTPLAVASQPVGALNIYSRLDDAFGLGEQEIAGLIAGQAAGILAGGSDDLTAERTGHLRDALRAREVIAQAQGILMHRDAITAEAAAARLHRESRRADIPLRQRAAELVAHTVHATDPNDGD
jgi:GAF domain-containing protein